MNFPLAPFLLSVNISSREVVNRTLVVYHLSFVLSFQVVEVVNRTLVVYHLHAQTGRFTVWVNSSQSSLGRIQDFFRRRCPRLLLYFNTNKPHSFFFFCRIPVVLENRRSSHTRSAPGSGLVNFVPESRLPFVEISSIYRKTAVKA